LDHYRYVDPWTIEVCCGEDGVDCSEGSDEWKMFKYNRFATALEEKVMDGTWILKMLTVGGFELLITYKDENLKDRSLFFTADLVEANNKMWRALKYNFMNVLISNNGIDFQFVNWDRENESFTFEYHDLCDNGGHKEVCTVTKTFKKQDTVAFTFVQHYQRVYQVALNEEPYLARFQIWEVAHIADAAQVEAYTGLDSHGKTVSLAWKVDDYWWLDSRIFHVIGMQIEDHEGSDWWKDPNGILRCRLNIRNALALKQAEETEIYGSYPIKDLLYTSEVNESGTTVYTPKDSLVNFMQAYQMLIYKETYERTTTKGESQKPLVDDDFMHKNETMGAPKNNPNSVLNILMLIACCLLAFSVTTITGLLIADACMQGTDTQDSYSGDVDVEYPTQAEEYRNLTEDMPQDAENASQPHTEDRASQNN